MRRVRFEVPYSAEDLKKIEEDENYSPDTRAMVYPTEYPHWFSGSSFTADIVVAFAPDEDTVGYIKRLWPEFDGNFSFNDHVDKIESSSRFQIDYEIYDESGRARTPGMTAAEVQAERERVSRDLDTALQNPKVDELGGKLYDLGSNDPKVAAEFLHKLQDKGTDGLSD